MELSPARSEVAGREGIGAKPAPLLELAPVRIPRAPRNGLAPSLERRRLQFYLALVVMDAVLMLGSFSLVAALYEPYRALEDAMLWEHCSNVAPTARHAVRPGSCTGASNKRFGRHDTWRIRHISLVNSYR